jgi:flagellar protein FliT
MASLDDVLARYADLAGTVAQMVDLARERQWGPLPVLDAHCAAIVEQLRAMELEDLSTPQRAHVLSLASRIRADQDALASMMRPQFVHLVRRMAELQRPA